MSSYLVDRWKRHEALASPRVSHEQHTHEDFMTALGSATSQDLSVICEAANGVVACIHAWWHTDRTPQVDPLAEDQAALETSRQRILATADRFVPGHGEPFEAGRSS